MDYSLTTMLIVVTVLVVAMAIVVPVIHRVIQPVSPSPPPTRVHQWADPSRPSRCQLCRGSDIVPVRGLTMTANLPGRPALAQLPAHPMREGFELELLVCATCGHSEVYATSPSTIRPFSRLAD